jgi:hypothetical protein
LLGPTPSPFTLRHQARKRLGAFRVNGLTNEREKKQSPDPSISNTHKRANFSEYGNSSARRRRRVRKLE